VARRKPGLGRGLAELLGETTVAPPERSSPDDAGVAPLDPDVAAPSGAAVPHTEGSLVDLPVTSIRPNPRQPRRSMDAEGLEELARSISSAGIVQPIIVRAVGDGYELVAGERRWRAAQMAGFSVVPAILRSASDVESLELALIENVVRQQLNPLDEALALHMLLEDLGVTQEQLGARVGKSRPAIANKIRLLELPAPVQQMLAEGRLSEGHGRALLGAESRAVLVRLARKAADEGWSVRVVEAAVRRANDGAVDRPVSPSAAVPRELLEQTHERFFGTFEVVPRVKVRGSGGSVELPFRDLDHLRELLDRLGDG
jgi:ParB family chromosome partitioning protein